MPVTDFRTFRSRSINRTYSLFWCDDCGDVIEPDDYYYTVTVKSPFGFIPDEKYKECVGCYEVCKDIGTLEAREKL